LRGSHYTTNIVNGVGNFAEIGFTPITSFVPDGRVAITFWVEDVSKLSTVTIYLADAAGYTNFITSQINMMLVANKFAVSGWHTIYVDPLLAATEGQTWGTPTGTVTFGTTAINTIKVRFTPVAGQSFNVSIADIVFGGKNKPSIVLFFDDGYKDNLDYGAPIAEQNGLRINIPVIQSMFGGANYLTVDQALDLQARGHAILNHSYDNTQWGDAGAGSDVSQYISLVDSCRAFLNANGLGKYSDYFVYPGGLYVDSLVSGLRLAGYKAARGASFAGLNKTYNGNPQLDFISGSYVLDQGKTYAQVEALVNKAIDTGGHMFMHGHRLQASAGVAAWAVEDYKKLAGLLGDYLRNGLIDNPTYPEFISRYY
jgi:peptidoglycan/xylan/chitin deacetylase (PgdA/CDA1 family)